MKEYIGKCDECKEPIYCLDGFFNGIHTENGLICFECEKKRKSF